MSYPRRINIGIPLSGAGCELHCAKRQDNRVTHLLLRCNRSEFSRCQMPLLATKPLTHAAQRVRFERCSPFLVPERLVPEWAVFCIWTTCCGRARFSRSKSRGSGRRGQTRKAADREDET